MPISGVSTDYTGRTKDISIFQGVMPTSNQISNITPAFGTISTYCAGVQKLIQRYTICLLTELGSQLNYAGFGTNLLTQLNNRSLSLNTMDLYPIFNTASASVITTFREYQANNPSMPLDEQLNTALLNDVLLTSSGVQFKVMLYPMATGPLTFIIPLP